MIGIVFLILKIIGIILLCILSVLVLAILVILFWPIRYSISAKASNTKESISVHGQCRWLLGAVGVKFGYDYPEFQWSGHILFINLHKLLQAKEDIEIPADDVSRGAESKRQCPEKQESDFVENIEPDFDISTKEHPRIEKNKESKKHTKTKKNIFDKIKDIYKRIKFTIIRIYDNIKLLMIRKDKLIDFLYEDTHQHAFQKCKNQSFYLLRKYKPSKLRLHGRIGFEDPSLTGKMVAWLSVIYPIYGDTIEIMPDFEEVVVEGDGVLKGKVYGYPLVMCGLRLIVDKKIRQTVNDFKNIKW